jgi:glutathione peroxidase-family protein
MGKMEFSHEISIISHIIVFQAVLAQKRKKKKNKSAGWNYDNFLVYDGKKLEKSH